MKHRLVVDIDGYAEGGTERSIVLHAFNHAPREMGAAACDAEQRRHATPTPTPAATPNPNPYP